MMPASNVEPFWSFFQHLYPQFSQNHLRVYRLLWRIEPLPVEVIMKQLGLARSTTYLILNDLVQEGLIHKTHQTPVSYFAENPVDAYSNQYTQLSQKLKKGKQIVQKIVQNETSLSEELYLIELDGGKKRILTKKGREKKY
jgi:predicted transcriptional regulator